MDISELSKLMLFNGIPTEELRKMLNCLKIRISDYKKGETIFLSGSEIHEIGLVLSGSVRIESNDLWGNRGIISIVKKGSVFAESYALTRPKSILVDVVANGDTRALFLSAEKIMCPCGTSCRCHAILLKNMLLLSSQKTVLLSERILDNSPKTIRGRLMSFFSRTVAQQGTNSVTLPFDRQQFADYLNVDRSALSKELSKMRDDGIIVYKKNNFTILKG